MTLTAKINGVDYASTRVRMRATGEQGISGLSAAADGTMSQGGIILDDPLGEIVTRGWSLVEVEETACTAAPRLFTGYVAEQTYRRGKYKTGPGREIDIGINDTNVLLQDRVITGSDGQRPAENDTARLAWLLGSDYLDGLVADLGLVNGAGRNFDATNYIHKFANDVLGDLVGPRGQIFFTYWDQLEAAVGLFYDAPDSTAFTSTLTISNVPGDYGHIDDPDTTCFVPYIDGELVSDPSEVFSLVDYIKTGGHIVRTNPTTNAAFFPDIGYRGTVVENMGVGLRSTAITFANRILDRDSTERVSVTVTVRLPKTKIGLIDAGQRLQVRFQHLPGFESFTYTRVEKKTITQTDGTRAYYDLNLTLSTHGILGSGTGGGTGGGSTTPFPVDPPQEASHWWPIAGTGIGDETTIVSDETRPFVQDAGVVYTYHFTIVTQPHPGTYSPQMGLSPQPPLLTVIVDGSTQGEGTTVDYDGTFTDHLIPTGDYQWFLSAADGDHSHTHTVTVTGWIDPAGWDTGEGSEPPPSGAPIPPGNLFLDPPPDGSTTDFTVVDAAGNPVPFASRSLHVALNGSELESGRDFTETNNTTASVSFTHEVPTDAETQIWAQGL